MYAQRAWSLSRAGTPYPSAESATSLTPSVLAGVAEDHSFEQFFFDEPTRRSLLDVLYSRHQRPLLLCAPSLAVDAEKAGAAYLLLDRDERFAFLPGFRPFDLDRPSAVDDFAYDAVLCDPPFANFDLARLRHVLDVLAGADEARRAAPLYLAFNARREEAIRAAFGEDELVRWGDGPLGYTSVKASTQQHIHLYGPREQRVKRS